MNSCAVTTGFFVLKRCGVLAATTCVQCTRPLCAAHVAEAGLCPECSVARGHGTGPTSHPVTKATHRRRAFYAGSSHHFSDSSWYDSLDRCDREPFEPGNAADPDYAVGDGTSLVDS